MKIDIKKLKILIFIVFFVIILLLGIIIFTLKNNSQKDSEKITDSQFPEDAIVINNNYQKLTSINTFLTLKNCVDLYYSKYSSCFMTVDQYRENYNMQYNESSDNGAAIDKACESARKIYLSMLMDDYVKDENITLDNFTMKVNKIGQVKATITEIYEQQKNENISVFFVKGYLRDKETDKNTNLNIVLIVDKKNKSFKIYPKEYYENKKFNELKIGDVANIDIPDEIQLNNNESIANKYNYQNFSNEAIIQFLVEKCKEEMLYNTQIAYNDLDDEYKKAKFADYNEFLNYVEINNKKYKSMSASKYSKNVYNDYNQYVCIDNNNNYCIFNQDKKDLTKFSVILDTYTVDIPQFIEKYEKASNNEKVALNINKFISAINDESYKYAYSLLSNSFKQNNFTTQQQFENYIKQILYENNIIKDVSCEEQGKYYIATTKIANSVGEEKEIKFIVKLDEERKFEMSFEIK